MTVETRYFRSDEHTVNGLTAKKLLNTSDTAPSAYTGEIWADTPKVASVYFEFNIRHADGSLTYLNAFQKTYSEEIDQDVIVEVSIPLRSLQSDDAIQVEVIFDVGGTEYMHEFFITEQLNAWRLNNATWKVIYYIYYWKNYVEGSSPPWVTIAQFSPKRIEDFTYDEPVNFSKTVSDAIGVSDVIEKARVAWRKMLQERVKLSDLMNTLKTSGGAPENWLSGWQYRKKHEIDGSSAGAVADYQIRIKVHYGSGTDDGENVYLNGKCKNDFGDVRFTADDGVTLLDYWMEEKVDGDYAVFWLKVPSIPASPDSTAIYIYYGKSDATYVGSGADTFLFFDDFEDGDVSDWAVVSGNGVNEASTTVVKQGTYSHHIDAGSSDLHVEKTLSSAISLGFAVELWAYDDVAYCSHKFIDSSGAEVRLFHRRDDAGRHKPELRDSGGTLHTGLGSDNFDLDKWHKLILYFTSDGVKFKWLYNGETDEGTYGPYPGISDLKKIQFAAMNYAKGVGYQDVIFVHNYVDPEPSHGTWYAEEEYAPAVNYELMLAEAVGACDVYSRSWSAIKPLPDQIGAYDAVTPLRRAGKLIKDYVGLFDSLSKHPASLRADSLAILDAYATVKSLYRYLSDAVGVYDYKFFAVEARLSDLVALYDTASRHPASYIGDFINLSDRFSSYIFGKITLADGIGLYDALAKVFTAYRTYSEPLGIYDALVTVKAQFRSFAELIDLVDVVAKSASLTRGELAGVSDVIEKVFTAYREYADSVGLLDIVSKQPSRTLADHTGLYDVASKAISRRVEDSTALSDLVERHPATLVADSISLYDAYIREWTAHKEVVEAVGLLDVLTPVKALFEEFSEPMTLADAFARKWDVKREYSEDVELCDEVTRRWGKWILLTESIAAYDEEYLLRLRKAVARILSPKRILPAFREQSPDRVRGPGSE